MSRERGGKRNTSTDALRRRALAELRALVDSGAVDQERVNRYLADLGANDQADGATDRPALTADQIADLAIAGARAMAAKYPAGDGSDVATECNNPGGATGRPGRRSRLLSHPTRSRQARTGRE